MNEHLFLNPTWFGPLRVAIQRAIVEEFTEADWIEFGYLTGFHDQVQRHSRLLRSKRFGDDDYGACVFQMIQIFEVNDVQALLALVRHPKIRPDLERSQGAKLADLGLLGAHVPAITLPITASEVVRRALSDSDNLLSTSGATSAIDRLHTALHGYLRSVCTDAGIPLSADATITQAYKALRQSHPALRNYGEHDSAIGRILSSFASVIDALNMLRNHGSVAHPNDRLAGPEEGALVVNAVRTMFHYLSQRLAH